MNGEEHLAMARELMERANQESSDGGNEMIAADLLWGAFAHCLITVALNDTLPHDSRGAFRRIAQHLDAAQGGNKWTSRFGSAAQLTPTSTTETCRPGNCKSTGGTPRKEPWNSLAYCEQAPEL